MAARRTGGKPKNSVSVDFTGVEVGGGAPRLDDGEYLAEVVGAEVKTSENSGEDYINWKLKVEKGTLYHMTSLQPQALWKLRSFLEACGFDVPDAAMDIDFDDITGAEVGIVVENETYQGKKRPRVVECIPAADVEGGETSDNDQPPPKNNRRAAPKDDTPPPSPRRRKPAEPEQEDAEIEVGSSVTFEDDGKTYTGTVSSINVKKGEAVVKTKKDGEWELELSDLTLVE